MTTNRNVGALVREAQRGDQEAKSALVAAFLRAAYAVALSIVSRPADAEDVAQDAFVSALEQINTCREPERFAGWMLQIVRNRAHNWLDRRRLRDVASNPEPIDRGGDTPQHLMRIQLMSALTALPPTQREVVLLHDLEEWTHAEIAEALDCSEVMSRQHLFIARRTLRTLLGGESLPEPRMSHER